MAAGKKYEAAKKQVEPRGYEVKDAMGLLKKIHYANFNETVEVHMRLGVDPKHADQMVRGTVVLPHGLGKSKKVCVIASGDKIREAEAAGADFVGGEDIVEKIAGGWIDFVEDHRTLTGAGSDAAYGARCTPSSVTIAEISSPGVTSKAGFRAGKRPVTSAPSRSSIGIAAPSSAAGSIVEVGATITKGIAW